MSTVRREIVLPVERERAWELLTEPAELSEWLADDVELEPEEGAPLRAAWADGEARAGVVEEVEELPPAPLPLGRRCDRRSRRGSSGRSTTRPAAPACRRGAPARPARAARHPRRTGARAAPGSRRWRAPRARSAPWDRRRLRLRSARRSDPARGDRPPGAGAGERVGLAGELPVSRQAVAKHLAALDRAGLVAARREGRETRYTLDPAPMGEAMAWMAGVGAQWDERLARLARRARA